MLLDITKLENPKPNGNGITYGCPACIENGSDKSRNHLKIFDGGKFGCVVFQDKSHYKRIIELAGSPNNLPQSQPEQISKPVKDLIYDKSCLLRLLPSYDYWINRKIDKEVLKKIQGGLAINSEFRGHYVIPIFNEKLNIIGFDARYIGKNLDKPRFKKRGRKTNWLWPLHINKQLILEKKEVILTEGVADTLSLMSCGIENVLCCFGKSISNKLLNSLVALNCNKIILAFNNDEAGLEACKTETEKLVKFFDESKIICKVPITKDLNELLCQENGIEKIKEWYNQI